MRLGPAQGSWVRANSQSNRSDFLGGKTTNLGLIPVIFVALFRVFAANSWAGVYTEGTTVPLSAYRGSSGQVPEVDLIR